MLAFSSFCDAHFHLFDILESLGPEELSVFNSLIESKGFSAIDCATDGEQLEKVHSFFIEHKNMGIYSACAIHPFHVSFDEIQNKKKLLQLQHLLEQKKIQIIGECGLDFYTDELKRTMKNQMDVFESQLLLAGKYEKPVVLHIRKAFSYLNDFLSPLGQLPSVLFHGFGGGPNDLSFIMKHLSNSYFSFGANLLQNSKKALACIELIPLNRLLLESDAPFGPFRDFSVLSYTKQWNQLIRIVCDIKKIKPQQLCHVLNQNFVLYLNNE